MKVVILAGGYGTRIFEETVYKPKPLIEIGGMPIIWHLMKIYSWYGHNDFILCLGYKKEFIFNYFENSSACTRIIPNIYERKNSRSYYNHIDNWKITLVDTGLDTMTGGRLKRIEQILKKETFLLSYGDTLSDVNIDRSVKLHKEQNVIGTLTTVQPVSNYGVITFDENQKIVNSFKEKPIEKNKWINGGFYVFEPEIFKYLKNDFTILEEKPLELITKGKKLAAYKHKGYWASVETYKDKLVMEDLWNSNEAKWNVWEQKLRKVL